MDALASFDAALAACDDAPSEAAQSVRARVLGNLGVLLAELGRHSDAVAPLREALSLHRDLGDHRQASTMLGTLGFVAHSTGRYGTALRYYEEEVAEQRLVPAEAMPARTKAVTYNNYAALLHDLGDTTQAAEMYRRAREQHLTEGDRSRATIALVNAATVVDEDGRIDAAASMYRQAADEARADGLQSIEAAAMSNLGLMLSQDAGRAEEAERILDDARSLATDVGDGMTAAGATLHLAQVQHSRGDLAGAEEGMRAARLAYEEIESRDGQIVALAELAKVVRDRGRDAESFDIAESALALVEETRTELDPGSLGVPHRALRQAYFGESVELYDDLCLALVDSAFSGSTGSPRELYARAFDTAERRRARELDEAVSGARPRSIPTGDLAAARQLLDARSAFVTYVIGHDRGVCFCVTLDALSVFRIDLSHRRLASWVHAIRAAVETEAPLPPSIVERLVDAVLAPPMARLREAGGVTRLILVADGPLHLLPFACLPIDGGRDAPMLVDEHELEFTPSVGVAQALERRGDATRRCKGFLGYADPVLPLASPPSGAPAGEAEVALRRRGALRPLPNSRVELECIVAMLREDGWDDVDVLLGARCTKASLYERLGQRTAGWRWVHFATHGLLDLEQPELTGLLFSPDGESDPYWRVTDVSSASLIADLVVASACDTANGKTDVGEGVLGLARALLLGGAAQVCASLWMVDDEATGDLMVRFYSGLVAGLSPAGALRQAQLAVRDGDLPHPASWAGFVVFR